MRCMFRCLLNGRYATTNGCDQVKRREFITLLGSASAWPLAARAQQPAIPVVGFLNPASPEQSSDQVRAFLQGLADTSYVDGRNVTIEYRWAEGRRDRLPEFAADLVRRRVAVIMAASDRSALAAKSATAMIPIVFTSGNDPVAFGLIASLSRPGGNLTGVTTLNVEVGPKRLELLHEMVPSTRRIAVLINPSDPSAETLSRDLDTAARTLGLELDVLHASSEGDFDGVFATLRQRGAGALVIGADPFFNSRIKQLATLTVQHAVPAVYQWREFAAAGGLLSYGSATTVAYRLAGNYCGRVLRGEKPADLPVQQATKVELIINLKTAKALGLEVPPTLLARAEEVIE
jgi:putative tryptophan/tyrosine transport system substrate-binding protein